MHGTGSNEILDSHMDYNVFTTFAYKRNCIIRMYDIGVPFLVFDFYRGWNLILTQKKISSKIYILR